MSVIWKIIRSVKLIIVKKLSRPNWVQFKNRYNDNVKLFISANLNSMFNEMSKGLFDNFIYDELDKTNFPESLVIWDVGSHIGYHALNFASFVGKNGKVVAFEPNPYNHERLKLHLNSNQGLSSRIILFDKALSDSSGKTVFSLSNKIDSGESTGGYINSVIPPLGLLSYKKFIDVKVETAKGDDIVDENKGLLPDIMKIDVEGAELLVLKGCEKIINEKKPVLFIEIHNILMMHYVTQFLMNFNYSIKIIDEENATISRCFILAKYSGE